MFPSDSTIVLESVVDWARWLRAQRPPAVEMFLDEAVESSALDLELTGILREQGIARRRHVVADGREQPTARQLVPGSLVLALGGGRTIDLVKLSTLVTADPDAARWYSPERRCGFVMLPNSARRANPLSIVPTTLGTGAECSRSACVLTAAGKRLLFGEALRADSVLRVPDATRSLPVGLVTEGLAEVFLRTTSCYIANHEDLPEPDAWVEQAAARLIQLGREIDLSRLAGAAVEDRLRLEIARLSGTSHSVAVVGARRPFSDPMWPLANELSMWTVQRKAQALAAIAPPVWQRIDGGDERLGSRRRLRRLWHRLRSQTIDAPSDPAAGVRTLLADWGLPPPMPLGAEESDRLAARTLHAWGRGLPTFPRLSQAEVSALYREASTHGTTGIGAGRV